MHSYRGEHPVSTSIFEIPRALPIFKFRAAIERPANNRLSRSFAALENFYAASGEIETVKVPHFGKYEPIFFSQILYVP
jgi:hypothetical protein